MEGGDIVRYLQSNSTANKARLVGNRAIRCQSTDEVRFSVKSGGLRNGLPPSDSVGPRRPERGAKTASVLWLSPTECHSIQANVLIDETGRAQLADFGLCRIADCVQSRGALAPNEVEEVAREMANADLPQEAATIITSFLTQSSQSGGTPNFMAPEVIASGAPSFGGDIWAFGMLAYEVSRSKSLIRSCL